MAVSADLWLMLPDSFDRWCFRLVDGVRDVPQYRGEPGDRCRVFDPFWESVLDSGAPRIVCAGFPDSLSLLLAHGRVLRGGVTFRARLVVRPVACVRAFTCRRACERRDGTTGRTITHGDGSSVIRARQRPRLTRMARPASARLLKVPVKLRALPSGNAHQFADLRPSAGAQRLTAIKGSGADREHHSHGLDRAGIQVPCGLSPIPAIGQDVICPVQGVRNRGWLAW